MEVQEDPAVPEPMAAMAETEGQATAREMVETAATAAQEATAGTEEMAGTAAITGMLNRITWRTDGTQACAVVAREQVTPWTLKKVHGVEEKAQTGASLGANSMNILSLH